MWSVASLTLKVILVVTKENPMLKLDAAFRNPREKTFRRTPCVAMRVVITSNVRMWSVASLTLKAILVTKEHPMLKLENAFRNPREKTFRRTPGVAMRVVITSNVRT
jgi:regulation of enolase protein 1 (concanavalin A-like superfamily)